MIPIQIISKHPEHPVLAWKAELLTCIPLGPCWWDRFYTYLLSNADHPYEVGYSFARVIDLIAKGNGAELLSDMPDYLPSLNGSGYLNDVMDGILKYRRKLGHIEHRRIALNYDFKRWHWQLFESHAHELNDNASNILKWAWSKYFWSPASVDGLMLDDTHRFLIAAMIIKNTESFSHVLFDDIKKRWVNSNVILPRGVSFYSKDPEEKTLSWFFYLCPEYDNLHDLWFQYSYMPIYKIAAMLKQSLQSEQSDTKAPADIQIIF